MVILLHEKGKSWNNMFTDKSQYFEDGLNKTDTLWFKAIYLNQLNHYITVNEVNYI